MFQNYSFDRKWVLWVPLTFHVHVCKRLLQLMFWVLTGWLLTITITAIITKQSVGNKSNCFLKNKCGYPEACLCKSLPGVYCQSWKIIMASLSPSPAVKDTWCCSLIRSPGTEHTHKQTWLLTHVQTRPSSQSRRSYREEPIRSQMR